VGSSVWGMEVLALNLLVLALGGGASAETQGFTMRTAWGSRYGSPGYNGPAMTTSYRAQLLVAMAIFVLAFSSFHFYFDATGLCGLDGCPEPSQSSHAAHSGSSSTSCVAAVLVAFLLVPSLVPFSCCRRAAKHRCPAEAYPSPDTPPPRSLSSC
jgi:hypothetical protein